MQLNHNKPTLKKIAAVMLALICAVALAGCGSTESGASPRQEDASSASAGLGVQGSVVLTQSPSPVPTVSPPAPESEGPGTGTAAEENPTAGETPMPEKTAEKEQETGPLQGLVIGLDPGHQAWGNSDPEPVAPGSSETKPKVSSGTSGVVSGIDEHVVNLKVGLKLKDMLEEAGAAVVMTRTSADVDISNKERAQLFNEEQVDLGVRLHCNGIDDRSVRGAFMIVPKSNPYKEKCDRAAELILKNYIDETGLEDKGIMTMGNQTGFNWCERPVVNIEMGHMSNSDEDLLITDGDFQTVMAKGIFKGILEYFDQ